MRALSSLLIATTMCLFGLGVLSLQIFAWHHLKVVAVIGAAVSGAAISILYDQWVKSGKQL